MNISILGVDLGKSVFHVYGVDQDGRAVLQKKLSRTKLFSFMANLPSCLVGIEGCGGKSWTTKSV